MMASSTSQNNDYWPIYLARSDGQGYPNLDHNPLKPDDERDVATLERWEIEIGKELAKQLAPKDDSKHQPPHSSHGCECGFPC
jgi:hypothetical protein